MNTIEGLQAKIHQLVPLIYVLSDDEHRAIVGINSLAKRKKFETEVYVYKSTTGIISFNEYVNDIDSKAYTSHKETVEPNDAVIHVYKENKENKKKIQVFIFTEADMLLDDNQIVRRLKDFVVQADNCDRNLKQIILLSSKLHLPDKIEKYLDVIVYPYPSDDEIKLIIEDWVGKFNRMLKDDDCIEVRTDFEVVNSLKGLITPQIYHAISACISTTRKQERNKTINPLTNEPFKKRLDPVILNNFKREMVNKTSMLKLREPTISFKDVGGLGRLKTWLKKSYGGWTTEGKKFGLPLLKGVLLTGLPGCGKSRIAEALANEWQLNFVQFDPSSVFTSRVGESEGNMRTVTARLEALAPVIAFSDEIDKGLSGSHSSSFSDAGTTERTLGIYLTWLNDHRSSIFSVATCNKIANLPPELISRFDEIFYIGPPNLEERKENIRIQIREEANRDPDKFNLDLLARSSSNLSGREIMQATKEAMYDAFHAGVDLNNDILAKALKKKIPIIKTMDKQLEDFVKWVGYDANTNDGVRARFANNDGDEIDAMFKEVLENADKKNEPLTF